MKKFIIECPAGYLTSYSEVSTSWGTKERAKHLTPSEVIEAMKTVLDMAVDKSITVHQLAVTI